MSVDLVQTWLQRALDALCDEQRWHLDALADALGPARIRFAVADERFDLYAVGATVQVGDAVGDAHVRVATTRATLRAILGGDLAVLTALRTHQLDLRGTIAALTAAARAWRVAVAGAVRSPRCAQLWTDFTDSNGQEDA